ncbi:MAG TPA: C25 family cysteine peptidase, partial [Candidatus Krumholzibacteria bacterium]|nr:C25 family cysteine peptidase [Candidatus Krumholzibacteria bacterium]
MMQRPLARQLALVCSLFLFPVAMNTRASAARLTFTVPVPDDPATVTSAVDGDRIAIRGREWTLPTEPGTPALPYRTVRIVLPQGQEVDTFSFKFADQSLVAAAFKPELTGDLIGAEGEMVRTNPHAVHGDAQLVSYLGTGTLNGYQVASFAVYPFGVKAGTLQRAGHVELEIETKALTSTTAQRIRHRDGWREGVRAHIASLVINPGELNSYAFGEVTVAPGTNGFTASTFPSLEGSPVDYVIITNDSLAATYQVLADWKTSKGVSTVVRTTEWIAANYRNGSDGAETIRNFVKDAYSLWGIKYLLLGGDSQQIPVRLAWSNFYPDANGHSNPADMYFGCLDGDWNADHDAVFGEFGSDNADLWAEVYVGRLPTRSNAEVNMMVNKIKNYERPAHTGFTKKVLFLAEVLFPSDWTSGPISLDGASLAEYVRTSDMIPGLTVNRNYQNYTMYPGSVAESRQAAIDSMNTGYDHVIHVGHGFRFNMSCGDASVVNSDADALTNGVKLMNLNLLNCTSSAFTYECIAEHYLRNPNGGAVSVIGSNDSAFPTVATDYMTEYYRLVMKQNVVHIGEAFARSREPRTAYAMANDLGDRWTHFTYTLLADPEMPLWTGPVTTLAVSYPASVNKGTTNISFTVTSGGNPVDSATVCLTKGNEDYRVGTTNSSGQVTIPFRAETNGTIDVVVTGLNRKRYEGTITVGGVGSYVAINNITVDDDNAGGTSGNGNGIIESGETVDLGFVLKNNGNATTGTVTVILRSSDAGVVVSDSTAGGGTIAAGVTGTMTGGCRVVFNSTLTDQHSVPFTLVIKNNGTDTWKDTFKKLSHRPKLALVKLRVDDTVTGNGDGVVQAGEQFKLFYKAKNFGTGTYPGGTMTAFDLDGAFTIGGGGTSSYPTIVSLGSAENTTGITLTESSVAVEHRLRLRIVDLYGRAYEDTVELRAPVAPTGIMIDPSLGPDRLSVRWTASASSDVAYYNVYRAASGAGPFNLASVDPVPHTLFVNTGLSPTTTYFYKVSTIDVSGNESALSAAASGSTNPAQAPGWPIMMEAETTSSPAVGDIDGDGTNEIVVGDKHVYAWHANGVEMIDGDASPLTWGPINTQGDTFVGHVALGRIDANKGLDIVAASRQTKQVFCFKYDGSTLPGWPRSTENFIRAGVVVGDINNDGLNEVIAIDELGVLYVWKKDGTEYRDGDSNPSTQGVFARLTGCTLDYSVPCVADIDNDGKDEIIVGT